MESREIQAYIPNANFTPKQEDLLREPLQASQIKERKGFGSTQLKYIKGDTAIDNANRIFGYGQWGYRIVSREHNIVEDDKKGTKIEYYTCDIELSVVGAAFPFPGDGMGIVTSPFTIEMHEKARKEATTDALKRALRHYGDQFGLCLYNEDDYVDVGEGVLKKVKEVRGGQASQGGSRQTVDSRPPDPTVKASNQALYNAALQAKLRAIESNVVRDDKGWLDLLKSMGIEEFAGGKDIAAVNNKITELKAKAS